MPTTPVRTSISKDPALVAGIASGALGFVCVCGVLAGLNRTYVPFDASGLRFVHDRLPEHAIAAAVFMLACLAWFAGLCAVIAAMRRAGVPLNRATLLRLIAVQGFAGLILAALPIGLDSDQYAYVGYAYAAEHGNPYQPAPLPADAPKAVVQSYEHWGNPLPVDAYGGAWTAGNALMLAPFSGAPATVQAAILRVAALAAACAVTALLYMVPTSTLPALTLVALNPLVLLETANGAHNDIFLVAAGLGALVLFFRNRLILAGMALGLATSIKFAYAPLVIPMALAAWSQSKRVAPAIWLCAGCVAVIMVSASPFGLYAAAVRTPLHHVAGPAGLLHYAGRFRPIVVALAVAAVTALLATDAWHRRITAAAAIAAAFVLVVSAGKIEPWYVLITIPLVAVPSTAARVAFGAFSAGGLWLMQSSFTGLFPVRTAMALAVFTACVLAAQARASAAKALPA